MNEPAHSSSEQAVQPLALDGRPLIEGEFVEHWSKAKAELGPLGGDELTVGAHRLLHRQVRIPSGAQVEVIAYGQGTPILLIPGLGITAPAWILQLAEYASENKLVVIHKPGHGRSQVTKDLSYLGVSEVIHAALGACGIAAPIHVVGTCVGAAIAAAYAAAHAASVASLTLINGVAKWEAGLTSKGRLGTAEVRAIVAFLEGFDARLSQDFEASLERSGHDATEKARRRTIYARSKCIDPMAYVQYVMDVSRSPSVLPIAGGVRCPTLVLRGELDSAVGPEQSRMLREAIPSAEGRTIAGSGHFPYLTHARDFNAALRTFLGRHS